MQVEYAFIAESADAREGLFYVLRGGTDIWHVPKEAQPPIVVGPMSFVVRITGESREAGASHNVSFTMVDSDGRAIAPPQNGEIGFGPHPFDRTRTSGALIHFRATPTVPTHGAYFFELHSSGRRLCAVPFWVVPLPDSET